MADPLETSCEHEGRHSAASLILGLPIESARIDGLGAGEVRHRGLEVTADNVNDVAVMIIVGALHDDTDGYTWPPSWPPSASAAWKDERALATLIEHHDISRDGYDELIADARALSSRHLFIELETRIADLLGERGYLNAADLRKALEDVSDEPDDDDPEGERDPYGVLSDRAVDFVIARERARRGILAFASTNGDGTKAIDHMEHITLKTVIAQTTDQGLFEAVISTASADRENDTVEPKALVNALAKWPRPIPLAWAHKTGESRDIFGSIDPASVRAVDGEVIVRGQVDFDSERGRDAWRLFKSRVIGFSYGYLQLAPSPRTSGGNHITALDVFEITATPTPMNNDTRVLDTKEIDAINKAAALADAEHNATQRKHATPIAIQTYAA